jgi:hypothetical protein
MSKKTPTPVPGTTRAANIVQLGALLELTVTRAQLPKAINTFNAGRTISFGPLAVNPNGITIHHRSLPWSAVKDARILMRNTGLVKKSGIPPLKMEAASRVPNYSLFVTLVRAILARPPSTRPAMNLTRFDGHPSSGLGAWRKAPAAPLVYTGVQSSILTGAASVPESEILLRLSVRGSANSFAPPSAVADDRHR